MDMNSFNLRIIKSDCHKISRRTICVSVKSGASIQDLRCAIAARLCNENITEDNISLLNCGKFAYLDDLASSLRSNSVLFVKIGEKSKNRFREESGCNDKNESKIIEVPKRNPFSSLWNPYSQKKERIKSFIEMMKRCNLQFKFEKDQNSQTVTISGFSSLAIGSTVETLKSTFLSIDETFQGYDIEFSVGGKKYTSNSKIRLGDLPYDTEEIKCVKVSPTIDGKLIKDFKIISCLDGVCFSENSSRRYFSAINNSGKPVIMEVYLNTDGGTCNDVFHRLNLDLQIKGIMAPKETVRGDIDGMKMFNGGKVKDFVSKRKEREEFKEYNKLENNTKTKNRKRQFKEFLDLANIQGISKVHTIFSVYEPNYLDLWCFFRKFGNNLSFDKIFLIVVNGLGKIKDLAYSGYLHGNLTYKHIWVNFLNHEVEFVHADRVTNLKSHTDLDLYSSSDSTSFILQRETRAFGISLYSAFLGKNFSGFGDIEKVLKNDTKTDKRMIKLFNFLIIEKNIDNIKVLRNIGRLRNSLNENHN